MMIYVKKKNPRTSCENQRLSRSTFQRFIYDSSIINWDDTISIKKEVYKFKFDTNFCFQFKEKKNTKNNGIQNANQAR